MDFVPFPSSAVLVLTVAGKNYGPESSPAHRHAYSNVYGWTS